MAHQALDHAEVLNVRWATVDPNPLAAKREARAIDEQAAEAVRRALPAEYVAQLEGRAPARALADNDNHNNDNVAAGGVRKRARIEAGPSEGSSSLSFGLEGYRAPDAVRFGNFGGGTGEASGDGEEMRVHATGGGGRAAAAPAAAAGEREREAGDTVEWGAGGTAGVHDRVGRGDEGADDGERWRRGSRGDGGTGGVWQRG